MPQGTEFKEISDQRCSAMQHGTVNKLKMLASASMGLLLGAFVSLVVDSALVEISINGFFATVRLAILPSAQNLPCSTARLVGLRDLTACDRRPDCLEGRASARRAHDAVARWRAHLLRAGAATATSEPSSW